METTSHPLESIGGGGYHLLIGHYRIATGAKRPERLSLPLDSSVIVDYHLRYGRFAPVATLHFLKMESIIDPPDSMNVIR